MGPEFDALPTRRGRSPWILWNRQEMQLSEIPVTLKLFATFRRYLPPESQGGVHDLSVPAGTRAGEVLEGLRVPVDDGVVILINGRTGAPQQVLEEGDVVAAFPAMAGG